MRDPDSPKLAIALAPSAKQPDPAFPPFTNAGLKAGGTVGENLGATQTFPGVGQNPGTAFVECSLFY